MQQNIVTMENVRLKSSRRLIASDLHKSLMRIAQQSEIIRDLKKALEKKETCQACHSLMMPETFAELVQDEYKSIESQPEDN